MKINLQAIQTFDSPKISIPDIIHFVWVGDYSQINVEYIDIWRESNRDKVIYLWLDEHAFLVNHFHQSIHTFAFATQYENYERKELSIKNLAFTDMFPKLDEDCFFDELAISFLAGYGFNPEVPDRLLKNRSPHISGVVIKSISELFTTEFRDFKRFYYYEIILRGNLASASDIVRLLVLYLHGGLYIDTDTLPNTDAAFSKLNLFLAREVIAEDDALRLLKTHSVLRRLSQRHYSDSDHVCILDKEGVRIDAAQSNNKQEEILRLIELDMAEFFVEKIKPLGKIRIYKNLLALGSLRRLKGVFFNHFVASHPESKSVRIILRVMKKRYNFLEENHCIFECYNGGKEDSYLSRLLTWRTELITKNYCVTSALTGPGLIMEVLLGLAYQLLDLGDIEPSSVAEFFQNEHYGIALYEHNLDTPEGYHSSWRD